jgi:hypothetical protein
MARKIRFIPHSTNILDYSCTMSGYEKESLVAEARLAAERKIKKVNDAAEIKKSDFPTTPEIT